MKICRILFTSLIMAGLLVSNSYAQKNWAQDADNAFKYYQYYEAVGLYKKAYSKVKKNKAEKARIVYQIAECYRLTNDTKNAESWYKKAITVKYPDPLATLYYADMLKINEKYDEGIVQYNAYKDLVPTDTRGAKGAESCTLAQQWKDNPTRYEVENMKQVNTKDMDFAVTYYDKKFKQLVFTSSREGSTGKEYDAWTGQSFTDLYLTAQDKNGKWSTPVSVGENINTKFNEGAACLNDKYNEMYFTRCGVEKKKQLGCQIYVSKKKGTSWDVPEQLVLGPDSFSYGHPSLSSDDLTLYFSSDMTGTYGGKDLWMVHRTKKTKPWDKAVNLGTNINSDGDEMYPFLRDDGALFFSSNGLIGMGGLDIFKVEKVGDSWGKPANMKYPINSAGDDFAIIFEGKAEKGYLSSNRKGGKGSDDIYTFYQPPLIFTLQGKICDDSTKLMIKGAYVTLVGSDGTIVIDTTLSDGSYKFEKTQFLGNTSYEIKVEAKDYFGAKGKESTVGLERSKDFIHDFCLVPIPKKPVVLPDILYPFNEWILLPEYQDSLNNLIQIMEENPRLVIELGSHTDARGSLEYNDSLSYKRAKSVVDYMVSKGIDGERLKPYGYGERVPRNLTKDKTVSYYTKGTEKVQINPPIVFTKGTILTEDYINQFQNNEKKFEAAHQLNRRTEFRVLSDDFVPKADTSAKTAPVIEVKTDTSSINDEEQKQLQPDNNQYVPDDTKKDLNQLQNDQQNNGTTPENTTGTQADTKTTNTKATTTKTKATTTKKK
jgi:peptidoglycan-associated lipoprotein